MKDVVLLLLLALALVSPAGAEPASGPAGDSRGLEKALAIDVRSAPLADVLARAAEASGVRMTAAPPAGDQRVTVHAARATVGELQSALRDLLRLRVSRRGSGAAERYTFSDDPHRVAQADAWRLRQAQTFLQSLERTTAAVAAGRDTETARTLRERSHREHPEFPDAALDAISADYLRQSLLLTPLTPALRGRLIQAGSVSLPLAWLSPRDQELLAAFARGGPGRAALDESPWLPGGSPARAQYWLLYGDRWTDEMLLAQAGAPGAWSTAMLPSILFRQRDDSALYPEAAERPDDPDVWRRLPPQFTTAGKDWDSLLTDLAATMQIRLAADSYARPWLFQTDQPLPEVAGIRLRDALDRLCRQHGYFWWKQDGWYLLRSRNWVAERRVAVPDRLLRGWVESVRATGALPAQDLFQLAALTNEQLLTLDVEALGAGNADVPSGGLDPNEAALISTGLLFFRTLPPAERSLAWAGELPALWLPPAQQEWFAAVAAQYGVPLLPENAESWSFAVRQEFGSRPEGEAGSREPVSGSVAVEWRFGPGVVVRASVDVSDRTLLRTVEPANPSSAR